MRRPTRTPAHPRVPAVNLLSPWVFEALAVRTLRRRFALAAVLLVLLVAAGWTFQDLRVGEAQRVLTVEQGETARLTAQAQELAPVRTYVSSVEKQKQTVAQAMAGEVYLSRVLEGLDAATPAGARIETASIIVTPRPPAPAPAEGGEAAAAPAPTVVSEGASACPGPDPFRTRTVVGCVTLSGSADSRATVGDLVVRLGDDRLFVEPFITTTTTADGERVVFSGTVGLSERSYSNRYVDMAALLDEVVPR